MCLDDTFGHDCSLTCDDCSNGGGCNQWKTGCDCPDGWTGIVCNQSEDKDTQIQTHMYTITMVPQTVWQQNPFSFLIPQHAQRDILGKTAPSPVSVKMVPAVIRSQGAVAVHPGSAGTCAKTVSSAEREVLFLNISFPPQHDLRKSSVVIWS